MKSILTISLLICLLVICATPVFATDNMRTTIDVYTENLMTNIDNNSTTMTYDFDGVSIAITILAVITIAGAVFFYLIPKK
ncbi:MAG: hypothetical protein IKV94_02445 [Clostridia bacterium]|nr:hypothetical protein [Clostridia bacterium]